MTHNRLFDFASILGLSSIGVLMVLGCIMLGLEEVANKAPTETAHSISRMIAIAGTAVFAVATVLLWVEGWIFLFEGWRNRAYGLNTLLVLFQILGPVFAAYVFHFARRKKAS